jgi:molybdenum cofactor guanylyltransferase
MLQAADAIYGLVLCGGKSSRMNMDKAFLTYHDKPQCYHLYEILEKICSKVLISCKDEQARKFDPDYNLLVDDDDFANSGPIAGVLSAFKEYPRNDFLLVGCDYPYIGLSEVRSFLEETDRNIPAAFFNTSADVYEPLLAWYPAMFSQKLFDFYKDGGRSLQKFLKINNAFKYIPHDKNQLLSVDTQEEFIRAKHMINNGFNQLNSANPD